MTGRTIPIAMIALASLLVIAGCGRKAALDTPYEATVQARKDALEEQKNATDPNSVVVPDEPTPPEKDKRFILDPLI